MPIATAAQLRHEVLVTVPGSDLQIRCRRPDLLSQIAKGVLPQPLVQEALRVLKAGGVDMVNAAPETVSSYAEFLDKWASIAALEPRIVLVREEATEGVLWVDDLAYDVKVAIMNATIGNGPQEVAPAVVEFRDSESTGADSGSRGATVQH